MDYNAIIRYQLDENHKEMTVCMMQRVIRGQIYTFKFNSFTLSTFPMLVNACHSVGPTALALIGNARAHIPQLCGHHTIAGIIVHDFFGGSFCLYFGQFCSFVRPFHQNSDLIYQKEHNYSNSGIYWTRCGTFVQRS